MKPECNEYQKNIAQFVLGDLTAGETQSLEDHLATCPHCRAEQEIYFQMLQLMKAADNEQVPRHFFVHPEEKNLNPWALFRLMKPHWQAITAAVAGLFILAGIAGVMSFTRSETDVSALKRDILKATEQKNQEARANWLQEVRAEIARSQAELSQQQKTELTIALTRLDSRLTGRMTAAEGRMRDDSNQLAVNLYRTVAQDRARDLSLIDLRFDRVETRNAIETRQTDAILDTLLQAAELRLK
jgi:hypothetical protein